MRRLYCPYFLLVQTGRLYQQGSFVYKKYLTIFDVYLNIMILLSNLKIFSLKMTIFFTDPYHPLSTLSLFCYRARSPTLEVDRPDAKLGFEKIIEGVSGS